jgi:hypothetical protein
MTQFDGAIVMSFIGTNSPTDCRGPGESVDWKLASPTQQSSTTMDCLERDQSAEQNNSHDLRDLDEISFEETFNRLYKARNRRHDEFRELICRQGERFLYGFVELLLSLSPADFEPGALEAVLATFGMAIVGYFDFWIFQATPMARQRAVRVLCAIAERVDNATDHAVLNQVLESGIKKDEYDDIQIALNHAVKRVRKQHLYRFQTIVCRNSSYPRASQQPRSAMPLRVVISSNLPLAADPPPNQSTGATINSNPWHSNNSRNDESVIGAMQWSTAGDFSLRESMVHLP